MTRRKRDPTRPELVPVWRLVNCPRCEALRGTRCTLPGGKVRNGSHMERIKRCITLRKPTRQLDLFKPIDPRPSFRGVRA